MKNFALVALLSILSFKANAMDIITTDATVMPIIQKTAEDLSAKKNLSINIFYISSKKLEDYLKNGNAGDVVISSHQNICLDLSKQGLANSYESKLIIKQNIYCSKPKKSWKEYQKVLFFLNEYHGQVENKVTEIAKNLNAQVYVVKNQENYYETIQDFLKQDIQICGFEPMLRAFDIEADAIQTQYFMNYYACPLIGLEQNAYQTLVNYYKNQL